MTSRKVFLTGATGLVGSHLAKLLLDKGYIVKASRRENSNMDLVKGLEDKIDWVIGDILDVPFLEEAIKDVDWVFHCAAMISFSPKEIQKMKDVNITGTANIVNISLHHQIKKLIHVSSIAAIGRPENHMDSITEETKWQVSKLNSEYAKSKFRAEMEVWRGMAEGLDILIVNPSVILGPGHWDTGSSRLFSRVRDGLKFYPRGSTGFIDVRDVASGMLLLAEKGITGERFILNGHNRPYTYFLNAVAQELGVQAPSIRITPFLQEVAWRVEKIKSFITGKAPLVTKETASLSSNSFRYSNEKSTKAGIEYIPLEETIRHTCSFIKK